METLVRVATMPLLADGELAPRNMSWVDPYLESPWVKLMSALAPAFPPPQDAGKSEVWRSFELDLLVGAGIVASVGILAAFGVLLRSCCNCTDRRVQVRPASRCLIFLAVITLLLAIVGGACFWSLGSVGAGNAYHILGSIHSDAVSAVDEGSVLSAIGDNITTTLHDVMPKCSKVAQGYLAQVEHEVTQYKGTLDDYLKAMKDVPPDLQKAIDYFNGAVLGGLVSIPLVLVALCVLSIVFIVCVTRGGTGEGHCSHCCVRLLGPLLFAPSILIVTLFTSADFLVAVAAGSFCKDVDENVMSYIRHFGPEDAYEAATYYINGTGSNPYLSDLDKAADFLQSSHDLITSYAPILKQDCHSPEAIESLISETSKASGPINTVRDLLAGDHIYPYYQHAVHDDVCKTFISGVGWLFVFQIIVGLVCLPILTFRADTFFTRWTQWQSRGTQSLIVQEIRV